MNYVQSLLRNSASKTIKLTVYSAEREREREKKQNSVPAQISFRSERKYFIRKKKEEEICCQ